MTAPACPRCGAPPTAAAKFCRSCGAPLTQDPAPAAKQETSRQPDPAPAPAPAAKRNKRRVPLLAGAGVAVLITLALVAYLAAVAIGNARYPPDQPVRDLFAALTTRDTATAADLATCTSAACTGDALTTGYEPPTDFQIGEVTYGESTDDTRRPDKSIAFVPVTYALGGVPQAVTMRVQRTGNGLARPFRIMVGATGRLAVIAGHTETVQIGGARAPNQEQGITVLPGRYTVRVPATDPLLLSTPATVDVPATVDQRATPVQLEIPVQIRPEVATQVNDQVRAFLDECAQQDTLTPPRCPFQVPGIVIGAADVSWRVDQVPAVEVVPTAKPGPADPPATVRTVTPGQVTVTYSAFTSTGGDRSTVIKEVPIEVSGTVDVDPAQPGRVVWSG